MSSSRMTFILEGRDNLSRMMDRAGDASDRLARRLLKLGAVGTGPALAASMGAATGAMVAGFASAGIAAGAFGAAVQPQVKLMTDNAAAAKKLADAQETAARKKQVAAALEAKGSDLAEKAQKAYTSSRLAAIDAEKAYQRQTKDMPKETADAALSLAKLKATHEQWSASLAKDTMPIFTRGLDAARRALPLLTPLVKTTAHAVSDFMDGFDGGGGGLKRFIDRVDQAAKKTLPDLLATGRNVFVGLGGIISAFLPTSDRFTGGLERGSAAFARWGQGLGDSEGFQRFMHIASEGNGSLENLALAALDLYDALRPITGAWVDIAEGAAKFIRWLPPETLAYIAGSLLAIKLASLGINAALMLISANPVTLTVAAVVLLGAVFVTAWEKSQTFRNIVTQVMVGVAQIALSQARIMLLGFRSFTEGSISAMVSLVQAAAGMFGKLPGVGHIFTDAAKNAETFKTQVGSYFDAAIGKIDGYSASVAKMPKDVAFKGNITDLDVKIQKAQARVDSLKQKRATAVGANKFALDVEVNRAQAKLDSLKQRKAATITASDQASAKINLIRGSLGALNGYVATTYVKTQYSESHVQQPFRRNGGLAPGFANGGMPGGLLRGPGTGTSDSIPMWWASTGEYVVNAKATAKNLALLEAINSDRLGSGAGMPGAGAAVAAGLASGMTGSTGQVQAGARIMAAAVTAGVRAELQIASPSKKMTALARDIGAGLIKGLTGSREQIRSTAADLAADIRSAFSGRKESGLLRYVTAQTAKLQAAATARDKVAAQLATARAYAADVTKNAREGASLSGLGLAAEDVTAGSIQAGLATKLANIRQFSRYIQILAKRGLRKPLLQQILNMGPDTGFAYASTLVSAGTAAFNSINSIQTQLDKATAGLGNLGADVLYDAGANAGRGFLAGLTSQQKAIEARMLAIAKGMDKAIRKALGIRSPSTVMARLGAYTTHGLARGLVAGVPVLDRALDTVSGRVAATRPVFGQPAAAGAGAGTVIYQIQVDVHEAMDPIAVGREFQRVLVQFGRAQGASVQLNVGG